MSVKAKEVKTIVNEVAKFNKDEIEFLFELLKNSMIPGKHIGIGMEVINKLKSQYQLLHRKSARVQKVESKESVIQKEINQIQQEEKQRIQQQDGELWIEDK